MFPPPLVSRTQANVNLTREAAEALVARGTVEADGGSGVRFSHDLGLKKTALTSYTQDQLQAFLEAIRCPVLIVRPVDGVLIDDSAVDACLSWLRRGSVASVPGGHHAHADKTYLPAVIEALGEFLGAGGSTGSAATAAAPATTTAAAVANSHTNNNNNNNNATTAGVGEGEPAV